MGKTQFIHDLRKRRGGHRQAVVAPTGIAALNAGAQTVHSAFRLPPCVLDPDNLDEPMGGPSRVLREIDTLVIDEISVVRADVFDAVDMRLREARRSPLPFGGVQLVLVGDPLRLPPVVTEEDGELLAALGYQGPFFHNARAWDEIELRGAELTHVFRQSELEFLRALNRTRLNTELSEATEFLNDASFGGHRGGRTPVLLTPTRAAADHHNRVGLDALQGKPTHYRGRREGRFDIAPDRLPAPELLALKPGAEVMAVKNDPADRW